MKNVNDERAIAGTTDVELTNQEMEYIAAGRINNVRANANGITAGGPTPGSLVASISTRL